MILYQFLLYGKERIGLHWGKPGDKLEK